MKIGVIIVTYNRLNSLVKALDSYECQWKKPEYILVVNNGSSDGTGAFLERWEKEQTGVAHHLKTLENNNGASLGFYSGFSFAMSQDADWIWLSDDDAFPEKNALSEIERVYECVIVPRGGRVSALCTAVINHGKIDLVHRRKLHRIFGIVLQKEVSEKLFRKDYFQVNLMSYVGAVFNKGMLSVVGLTKPNYYLYYDDTEHSVRLNKKGKILCIPSAKVYHDKADLGKHEWSWKDYYLIRNRLRMYHEHFRFSFIVLYLMKKLFVLQYEMLHGRDTVSRMYREAMKDSFSDTVISHSLYYSGCTETFM